MKKFTCYSEKTILDNGQEYLTYIIPNGSGLKTVYDCYVSDGQHSILMYGWPVDQRQAKEPKVFTPEEILEDAVLNIWDYVGELERLNRFEELQFDFLMEVDNRRRNN